METWEVVLILVLVTISVSVLVQKDMSNTMISILDNTFVQLAVLGAALGVAVVSPAVAIVAIATIVVVYYVRNLAKLQMVTPTFEDETPRIEVTEQTVRTMTVVGDVPVSAGTLPQVNAPPPADNKDVVANALKEHESRPPQHHLIGQRSTIGGTAPMKNQNAPEHESFPDPRGSAHESVPKDNMMSSYGPAPGPSDLGKQEGFSADVNDNDENRAQFSVRPYNDNQGQYNINEVRPNSKPGKYELADFTPGSEMGSNEFASSGVSIDDKVSNLQNVFLPSASPPPDFNNAFPARA